MQHPVTGEELKEVKVELLVPKDADEDIIVSLLLGAILQKRQTAIDALHVLVSDAHLIKE